MSNSISFYLYPYDKKYYHLHTMHKDAEGEIIRSLLTLLEADQARKFLALRIVKVQEVEPYYSTLRLYGAILPPVPALRPEGGFGCAVSGLVRSLVHQEFCEYYQDARDFANKFNEYLEKPGTTWITTYSGKTFKQY